MQTSLPAPFLATETGQQADRILRSCVHCGFCIATCPTYQLLGDELDSPRGRIYLIKEMLETNQASQKTRLHLDRCLTCRSCETTCPSGVEYGHLLDIGRQRVEKLAPRNVFSRLARSILEIMLSREKIFTPLMRTGQFFRPLMPAFLKHTIPQKQASSGRPKNNHARKMLLLEGCAQPGLAPHINDATARVLDRLGISLLSVKESGCCGAVSHHLNKEDNALQFIKKNIDAWWPFIEQGFEAIVITASGCGQFVKDYGHLLKHDNEYAEKAKRVTELTKDIAEIVQAEDLSLLKTQTPKTVAFHSPCTLQHGMSITGVVEGILQASGHKLTAVADPHLCCGSAGTYSILQPKLSQQLLKNKLNALEANQPELIATANIGCWHHLSSKSRVPVKHWIELLDTAE